MINAISEFFYNVNPVWAAFVAGLTLGIIIGVGIPALLSLLAEERRNANEASL